MVENGIAHDKEAMKKELETAKTDKTHPLHFKNAGRSMISIEQYVKNKR